MIRILLLFLCAWATSVQATNVIFILSDDHRYDFMSFMPEAPDFLETPNLDRLAREGAHLKNAFVSTSLCSPSRASILTGQYMHHHKVVDNQRPVPEGTVFFPEYLQQAGIKTAFVGKWHMGHDLDHARPGFDHWVSFKGQGAYFDPELNINGEQQQFEGYNADILTDQALEWLAKNHEDDFFMYLSFKAVHYPFEPAKRHHGRYQGKKIKYPETMAFTEENYETQPKWLKERRYGIHGIDHMETGAFDKDPVPSFDDLYWRFCETVHGLDENIGRVLQFLDDQKLSEDTLVLYMGDNGFALGEHGFYDKRDAFEVSIRVPMLARAPATIQAGTVVTQMVQNIDIASTVLDAFDVEKRHKWMGRRSCPCSKAKRSPGGHTSCTSIIGSGTFPPSPRPSPFEAIDISTSTTTVSGTSTDSTTSRPIRMNATT
jgi:N-acetylglucosamine-6-sulfatase